MKPRSFFAFGLRRFLAIGLIPLVVIASIAAFQSARLELEAARLRNSLVANAVKAEVESFLDVPTVALSEMEHLSGQSPDLQKIQTSLGEHNQNLESVLFVNRQGIVTHAVLAKGVAGTPSDFVGLDLSSDSLYKRAATSPHGAAWSGVFTSTTSGSRVIGVAVSEPGQTVYGTIRVDSLEDYVSEAVGQSAQVAVTDRNGDILFHNSRDLQELRPNWRNLPPIAQGIQGKSGSYEYLADGVTMLGSAEVIRGTGWIVLVQQERTAALRSLITALLTILVAMSIVAAVAVVAALNFSARLSRPVAELARVSGAIEHGDYTAEPEPTNIAEIAALAGSIGTMARSVRTREAELSASRENLEREVQNTQRALRRVTAMSGQLSIAEERERRHLAEELHDRVSQPLAVARMRLHIAAEDDELRDENIPIVDEMLLEAVTQTRAITEELASPVVYELGLPIALENMCRELEERFEIKVHMSVDAGSDGGIECIGDDAKAFMLRAGRELLMNVVKHAQVQEAWLRLESEASAVILTVWDEGVGVNGTVDDDEDGFGIFSIRERVAQFDGALEIVSAQGAGTHVTLTVPCKPQAV